MVELRPCHINFIFVLCKSMERIRLFFFDNLLKRNNHMLLDLSMLRSSDLIGQKSLHFAAKKKTVLNFNEKNYPLILPYRIGFVQVEVIARR